MTTSAALGAACGSDGRAPRDRARPSLPLDGPAAALVAEVVGAAAEDEQALRVLGERKRRAIVLEEHERLLHGLARQPAMRVRPDVARAKIVGGGARAIVIQHSSLALDREDAPNGVVDPLARHARRDRALDGIDDAGAELRMHHHVDAGVDGHRQVLFEARGDLIDRLPVGHDEPVET